MVILQPWFCEFESLSFGYFALRVGIGDNAAHLSVSMIVFRVGKAVSIVSNQ
jgi:hypothetical protein